MFGFHLENWTKNILQHTCNFQSKIGDSTSSTSNLFLQGLKIEHFLIN